jgi:hypothetical protein
MNERFLRVSEEHVGELRIAIKSIRVYTDAFGIMHNGHIKAGSPFWVIDHNKKTASFRS